MHDHPPSVLIARNGRHYIRRPDGRTEFITKAEAARLMSLSASQSVPSVTSVNDISARLDALATQVAGLATSTQLLANQVAMTRTRIDALVAALRAPTPLEIAVGLAAQQQAAAAANDER